MPYREEAAQLSFFDVIFSHVDFAYEMGVPVLRDVSVFCKAGDDDGSGQGSSGSGKTTIISLISRFRDMSKGSVTIGGLVIFGNSHRMCWPGKWPSSFRTLLYLHDTIANNIRVCGKAGRETGGNHCSSKGGTMPRVYFGIAGRLRYHGGRRRQYALRRREATNLHCPRLHQGCTYRLVG